MDGNKKETSGSYNPIFNVNIYKELEELRALGYISSLTINDKAFTKDLYITFNLTNQKIGDISHSFDFEKYTVELVRDKSYYEPAFFIRYPRLGNNTPHLYMRGNLCLHHPKNYKWYEGASISNTLIPWTFLWVFYYETWLVTGKWLSEEVPH